MFIFRWLSLILIVLAVMLLGADLVGTLEKKALFIRSLQDILLLFQYDTREALIANFPLQIVNVANKIIEAPSWLTLGMLGFLLAVIAPPGKHVRPLPPAPPISR